VLQLVRRSNISAVLIKEGYLHFSQRSEVNESFQAVV